jgi:hypothetical protein
VSCRGKGMHAPDECDCYFKPRDFLDLLARERRWCELLLTAISIRAELRAVDAKSLADDIVSLSLKRRAQALRNCDVHRFRHARDIGPEALWRERVKLISSAHELARASWHSETEAKRHDFRSLAATVTR